MKNWIKITLWSLFGITVLVLMSMVQSAQKKTLLSDPNIIIHVSGENAFLTEDELKLRLKRQNLIFEGQTYEQLNVHEIETSIASMSEVKYVKVYTNIGKSWIISVEIRKPIARIFNKYGESYYLDETGFVMVPSPLYTARVVVVTGDISEKLGSPSVNDIINNDSLKSIRVLDDVFRISNYVCSDPLLQAQIGQIHLQPNGDFILIPQVGGQNIIFGTARTVEEVERKFRKLKVFYKEAMPYEGWNKYAEISLKYDRQIVCRTADKW
jgi:cell division protein FtsQ